jgi:hypothetical protein
MASMLFRWNADKNRELYEQRGLTFEDVAAAVEAGHLLDDIPHPNELRYPSQRVMFVQIDGYGCTVPYVVDGDAKFLKTIFPSRDAQKKYLEQK